MPVPDSSPAARDILSEHSIAFSAPERLRDAWLMMGTR